MNRWLLFSNTVKNFPYKLYIEEEQDKFLMLSVQNKWPGPGKKIFCLPNGYCGSDDLPKDEPVEECGIVASQKYDKKLTVILDRKSRRRCWFLFLRGEYKTKPGEFYEQVFWITHSSAKERRPGAYIPRHKNIESLEIIIDSRERRPYKFSEAKIERKNLSVGDYALVKNGGIIAVAERKTLDNLLHEIGTYDFLKLALQELNKLKYRAVVFESPYSDFINPKKQKFYSASYIADILADLFVSFPGIQFIFCDNRKFANEWVFRWFKRIDKQQNK